MQGGYPTQQGYGAQGGFSPGSGYDAGGNGGQQQPQASEGQKEDAKDEPTAPVSMGCYLWLPDGCPRTPHYKADVWKKDNWKGWADPKAINPDNEGRCLGERKESYVSWCGTQSVHMLFVTAETEAPNIPSAPGCYVWATQCPSQPWYSSRGWNFNWQAGPSTPEGCVGERLRVFQKWCGNSKAQGLWVNPPPKTPGCFIVLPWGCPRNPQFKAPSWKKDTWPGWVDGRVPTDPAGQEAFCLEDRRAKLREWCNAELVGTLLNRCSGAECLQQPQAQWRCWRSRA